MIMLRQETAFILEITSGERINSFEMSWWSCLNLLKTWKSQKSHHHSSRPKKSYFPETCSKQCLIFSSAVYNYILRRITIQKIPKNQKRDFKLELKIHKKIRLTKMVVQWTKDATLTDNHCGSRLWSLGWIRDVFL